jgi:hypothetical protein
VSAGATYGSSTNDDEDVNGTESPFATALASERSAESTPDFQLPLVHPTCALLQAELTGERSESRFRSMRHAQLA